MIMGHVGFGDMFALYIGGFHMQLFFIISGYFFKGERSIADGCYHQLKKLMVPYAIWGILYELMWCLRGRNQWLGLIWPNTIEVPINGALWFLPAIFWVLIIATLLFHYLKRSIALVIMLSIAFIGTFHLLNLPFSLDSALVGCGLFAFGYLVKNYFPAILKIKPIYSILLLIASGFLIFYNGNVNIRTNIYENVLLYFFNSVITTVAYWNLCRYLDIHFRCKVINIFKEIGRDSLVYLCTNQFILRLLWTISIGTPFYNSVFWHIGELVIVVGICFLLNRIIRISPIKFVLGEEKYRSDRV